MTDIARKVAAGAKRMKIRGNALAPIVVVAFMLAVGALAVSMPPAGAWDWNPPADAQPAHPHKHRHLPTPVPTPMALPPEIKAKVPALKPGPIPFHDGEQLIFQASWVGIPAAQARLEFHKVQKNDQNRWLGEIWIETNAF
ncbi:MAG TPA: hypothetical protein VE243_03625, partial [Candidatus Acidoferrum sp.]|nr:hypothetical protein [Candidatus Acidoferrum sp.]